jgi:hypothetical protein
VVSGGGPVVVLAAPAELLGEVVVVLVTVILPQRIFELTKNYNDSSRRWRREYLRRASENEREESKFLGSNLPLIQHEIDQWRKTADCALAKRKYQDYVDPPCATATSYILFHAPEALYCAVRRRALMWSFLSKVLPIVLTIFCTRLL